MYKNKCVCFSNVMWLMAMKMRLEMKNKSQRYDTNSPRSRHGPKYTKCQMCPSIRVVICINPLTTNVP